MSDMKESEKKAHNLAALTEASKLGAPDQKLVRLAKQMVLAEVNHSRAEDQKPPLSEIPSSWWLIHAAEVLEKARAKKIVTIISLWSTLRWPIPPVQYDVLAQDDDVASTLEDAFATTNMDGRPMGKQACATTAGDMMVLDGKHYLVEPSGFHKLTEAEAHAIAQLHVLQTCWGYERLVENRFI
jgi:hypothetical protein